MGNDEQEEGGRSFKEQLLKKLRTRAPELTLSDIPSSYQIVGDILLIKLFGKAVERRHEIGHAIIELMPYLRSVCWFRGVQGELREPVVEVIAGSDNTEAVHKENNCLFKLDVAKIMFSKGNLFERQRLIGEVKKGEEIIDMFAGIGYFCIPLAKFTKANRIVAIEKNPNAFSYLKDNIHLNQTWNIDAICGDNRDSAITRDLQRTANRVIMGYFPGTEKYLDTAMSFLKPGGILHYHNSFMISDLWHKPLQEIEQAAKKAGFVATILDKRKVKSIAPNLYHVVIDARLDSSE